MNNNIEGKVVVITGATSGLGEATARLLSGHGASSEDYRCLISPLRKISCEDLLSCLC